VDLTRAQENVCVHMRRLGGHLRRRDACVFARRRRDGAFPPRPMPWRGDARAVSVVVAAREGCSRLLAVRSSPSSSPSPSPSSSTSASRRSKAFSPSGYPITNRDRADSSTFRSGTRSSWCVLRFSNCRQDWQERELRKKKNSTSFTARHAFSRLYVLVVTASFTETSSGFAHTADRARL